MPHPYGTLKTRLRDGGRATGFWIQLFSPLATELLAECGYDCAMIDLEHGAGSFLDAAAMMQAMKGSGCAPLVRVPWNDHVAIKRALDVGAAGVMIPSVDSADEAVAAVAACRYPPAGRRGNAAPIVRAARYGLDAADYMAHFNDQVLVICQIESARAVANAGAIAAVEGVDLVFIGPMDLSGDMGHLGEPDAPEVRRAIAEVEAAVRDAGKLLGTITTPGRSAAELYAAGHSLVLGDSDAGLLRQAAQLSLEATAGLRR